MEQRSHTEKTSSTEQKIKEAAGRVFTRKGYAATRTRDIAEESGFNLALINYYFRSKQKLFDLIMLEHLQSFAHSVADILNERETTIKQKLELLVDHYIKMLIINPDLPLFILNEINSDPGKLMERIGVDSTEYQHLYALKQWQEMIATLGMPSFNPIHMLMNTVALTVFPFIGSPILRNRTGMTRDEFDVLMEERKKLIPVWIDAMLKSGYYGAENNQNLDDLSK